MDKLGVADGIVTDSGIDRQAAREPRERARGRSSEPCYTTVKGLRAVAHTHGF
jgi:hypothetical protein